MPTDFNTSHAKRAIREFNIRNGDFFDNRLSNSLIPVIPVLPVSDIVKHVVKNNTAGTLVFATPLDKDFYLTSAYLAATFDAAADSTSVNITATVDGVLRNIISLRKQTLTAYSDNAGMSYDIPIKIDRGTNVSVDTAFTVGTTSIIAIITGYLSDTLG